MKTKTIDELRKEFEDMAFGKMFSIERDKLGQYKGSTFLFWGGYWQCAKDNGIIVGEDAEFKNMYKYNYREHVYE